MCTRRMHCCTQCEWALRHRTSPYIDARGPTATQIAIPYINVRNVSMYSTVRKADASNASPKHASNLTHVISRDKFQPYHWPLLEYFAFITLHVLRCALLEIVLNVGSVVLEGAATSPLRPPQHAYAPRIQAERTACWPILWCGCIYLLFVSDNLRLFHTAKHLRIVLYRIAIFCVISYRICLLYTSPSPRD